jgi:TusA-related sulfurtransferase
MPVLKTRDAIRALGPGQVLEMLSDDPGSEPDMKVWAQRTGHDLVEIERRGAVFRFLIRKSG